MASIKKFYITTAIPYVNAEPHLGHALEFVQTDAVRRYKELLGFSAFLTTGADENSLKNVQAAEAQGITPAELCERNAGRFREMAKELGVSFDAFLRSSVSKDHWRAAQMIWKLCKKRGDIYRKKYGGLYCVGCEAFYTEKELDGGLCPEHRRKPEYVEEENYFFRLSRYQKRLQHLIESGKLKIIPDSRKNEVLAFIKAGLDDFSISRSKARAKGWGVPVPGSDQIMYVWVDALVIYLTAIGYGKKKGAFSKWWPADIHVIGKGITRFHAVYWPAILMSAGLPLPKALFVHGYITVNGQKISKSLGNVIDPAHLAKKYGAERLRYYMLRDFSPFDDGDFSERLLVEKTNAELVDNFSNLFYRVTSFIEKNFGGKAPHGKEGKREKALKKIIARKISDYKKSFDALRLNEALGHAMELSSEINRYFQESEPWKSIKKNKRQAATALYNAANALNIVCGLLYPFIPETAGKAARLLNSKPRLAAGFELKSGGKVKAEMLFKREISREPRFSSLSTSSPIQKYYKKESRNNINKSSQKENTNGDLVDIEDFKKLDIRVATIESVKDHPDADKLYIIIADLGGEKRQLVAGLKGIYTKEELKGKQILMIVNLKPAMLRGVQSNGMLLAADDGTLVSPLKKLPDGTKIR